MGIFSQLFDTSPGAKDPFWEMIDSESMIDDIVLSSNNQTQIILKHSNQCGTSFFAKKNLESIEKSEYQGVGFYMIDVIRQRSLSQYLSEKVEVRHQSPQLLILRNAEVIWYGSHNQVTANNLVKNLS